VEDGDIAIPNQRLGVAARCFKIKGVRDPICALSAPGRGDATYPWIAESIIEVGKAVLVATGTPESASRQWPTPSKFSKASPMGP
jgi:hypothetical protein